MDSSMIVKVLEELQRQKVATARLQNQVCWERKFFYLIYLIPKMRKCRPLPYYWCTYGPKVHYYGSIVVSGSNSITSVFRGSILNSLEEWVILLSRDFRLHQFLQFQSANLRGKWTSLWFQKIFIVNKSLRLSGVTLLLQYTLLFQSQYI